MLGALQRGLESAYQIDTPVNVEDFLIEDPKAAKAHCPEIEGTPEALLVSEQDGELRMGLYLAPEDLEQLQGEGNFRGCFRSFCRAVEGVSHFVFLAWRAAQDWPVTRLEMELQAEIDKYALCRLAGISEGPSLVAVLFQGVRYRAAGPGEELDRYRTANALAQTYCQALESKSRADLLNELRHFYRLGRGQKLGLIAAL